MMAEATGMWKKPYAGAGPNGSDSLWFGSLWGHKEMHGGC